MNHKRKKNIKAKMQNFYKRWNLEYSLEERINDFKNNVLTSVNNIIEPVFAKQENSHLLMSYFKFIGIYITQDELFEHITHGFYSVEGGANSPLVSDIYIGGKVFRKNFESKLLSVNFEKVILYLQELLYLDIEQDVKNELAETIREDIELLMLDIEIKRTSKGEFLFYPKGAKLLDKGVVNEILDWLSSYKDSYENFKSAPKNMKSMNIKEI